MMHNVLISNRQYFFDGDTLQLYVDEYPKEKEEVIYKNEETDVLEKATIFITDTCNGKCEYCYEQHGVSVMTEEAADLAISYLEKKYIKVNKVSFFGGEPIINFHIIKYMVEELGTKIDVDNYEITTNAVLIKDEMLEFFNHYNFKITISFDGPDLIHDKLRKGCQHKDVLEVIKKIKKLPIGNVMELNCTFTKFHKESLSDNELEEYFDDLGVKYNITNVFTDIDWIKLPDTNNQSIINNIDESYEHLLNNSLNVSVNSYVSSIINAIVYHNYSDVFCNELCNSLAFDIDGVCYPCVKLMKKCKPGDLELSNLNSKSSSICNQCWAKGLCVLCTASIFLSEREVPYSSAGCNKKRLFDYSLQKFLNYLQEDPEKFQQIIDNYYQ